MRRQLASRRTIARPHLYADLEAYALAPTHAAKVELTERFDAIFTTTTCFALLNRQLKRLHAKKAKLLAILERPDVPLHTMARRTTSAPHLACNRGSPAARSRVAPARTRAASAAMPSSA